MALKVNIETDLGVNAEYIRIRDIFVNNDKKIVSFAVYAYATKEAREADKKSVYTENYEVFYDDIGYTTKEDVFELTYAYLKKTEKYKNSTDLM